MLGSLFLVFFVVIIVLVVFILWRNIDFAKFTYKQTVFFGLACGVVIILAIKGAFTKMQELNGYSMQKIDNSNFYQRVKEPLYRKMPLK